METALRALLKDPVIGLPVLCLVLLLAALVCGVGRSIQNGTFAFPSVNVWSKDLAKVLVITIVLWLSKLTALFIPEGNVDVFGVDLGPILSVAGPGVFFLAGATSAATFILAQVNAIKDSLKPPDPAELRAKAAKADALGDPLPKP